MNKELSASFSTAPTQAQDSAWLRQAGIVLAASALVGVCAHLSLPLFFTPVPLSMAPFAVLLVGLFLSPRLAFASLVAYLAEGAAGVPVFTPGPHLTIGIAHLFGPTGGYLLAYPVAAAVTALLWRRSGRNFAAALVSATLGSFVILACGALWMTVLTHASLLTVCKLAVLPFLPGDVLKIALAAGLVMGFQRLQRKIA